MRDSTGDRIKRGGGKCRGARRDGENVCVGVQRAMAGLYVVEADATRSHLRQLVGNLCELFQWIIRGISRYQLDENVACGTKSQIYFAALKSQTNFR